MLPDMLTGLKDPVRLTVLLAPSSAEGSKLIDPLSEGIVLRSAARLLSKGSAFPAVEMPKASRLTRGMREESDGFAPAKGAGWGKVVSIWGRSATISGESSRGLRFA